MTTRAVAVLLLAFSFVGMTGTATTAQVQHCAVNKTGGGTFVFDSRSPACGCPFGTEKKPTTRADVFHCFKAGFTMQDPGRSGAPAPTQPAQSRVQPVKQYRHCSCQAPTGPTYSACDMPGKAMINRQYTVELSTTCAAGIPFYCCRGTSRAFN